MINFILGISLTLNIVIVTGIIIYFKIKSFGLAKVQKDFEKKFFCSDEELNDMLDRL